jgi:hypothetical protein
VVPNIAILRHSISDLDYNEYLFWAYQVDSYISRISGILAKALCGGVAALMPQGTWLPD